MEIASHIQEREIGGLAFEILGLANNTQDECVLKLGDNLCHCF
jgi:hypothetical protein